MYVHAARYVDINTIVAEKVKEVFEWRVEGWRAAERESHWNTDNIH